MIGLSSLALLGACSGKTAQSTPVALADLPSSYAHAICDNIQGCCGQASFAYDEAKCVAAVTSQLQSDFANNTSTYDKNAAGACVAFAQSAAASCSAPKESDSQAACGGVFTGTKKIGEACNTNSNDCAPSPEGQVICDGWMSGTNVRGSQCTLYRTAQAGDACGFTINGPSATTIGDCQTNSSSPYYCASTNTCQPRLALGTACTSSSACVSGAGCVKGTCAPAPTAGQSCDDSFRCADGFYCSIASIKCAAQRKAGEPCDSGSSGSCAGGECSNGTCSAGSIATQDICAGVTKSSSGNGGSSSGGSSGTPSGNGGGTSNGGTSNGGGG